MYTTNKKEKEIEKEFDEMKLFTNYLPWNNLNIVLSLIYMSKEFYKMELEKKKRLLRGKLKH